MVDNYLALLKRAQTEPEAVAADVRSGRLSDYQVPVYITNIHPNECPAVDQQIEFLKAVATQETIPYLNGDNETCTYNVKDVLNDVFFIIRPTENPYALEHYQRGNVEGFDLNRDSTYQTQIESQVATADLVQVEARHPDGAARLHLLCPDPAADRALHPAPRAQSGV